MSEGLHGLILPFEAHTPTLSPDAFVAHGASVLGEVTMKASSSVWYNAVVRGDVMPIVIGERSNIQDLCMVHTSTGVSACIVGDDVTVGHRAILHGCTIGDACLIGMGAIILDGAVVEEHCLIAAGTLITPNTHIPAGSVVMGSPGRVRRTVSAADIDGFVRSAQHYVHMAARHVRSMR
ncbi:MAG: gamma carbonic anhydrase family protein [Myxococcota bacterium]